MNAARLMILALGILSGGTFAQGFVLRSVLLTGDQVPGVPGYYVESLRPPNLARDGRMGFTVGSVSDLGDRIRRLIVAHPDGSTALVASSGEIAPGGVGQYREFNSTRFALDGSLAFRATVDQGEAIFAGRPGNIRIIAGEQPDLPNGVPTISAINLLAFSPSGAFAIQGGRGHASEIWTGFEGSIQRVFSRMQAPGYPDGVLINQAGWTRVDALGNAISLAELEGGNYDGARVEVLSTPFGVTIQGGPPLHPGQRGVVSGGTPPVTNSRGTIGFAAYYRENAAQNWTYAALAGAPGELKPIARPGDLVQIRGQVGWISSINTIMIASNNQLAVVASAVDSIGEHHGGVWLDTPDGWQPLVLGGDAVVGLDGYHFERFASGSDSRGVGFTRDEELAFLGVAFDDFGNGVEALMLADRDKVTSVVAIGDTVSIGPGDDRVVHDIRIDGSPSTNVNGLNNDDGWSAFFNNQHELAMLLEFTDGSSGVFRVRHLVPSRNR